MSVSITEKTGENNEAFGCYLTNKTFLLYQSNFGYFNKNFVQSNRWCSNQNLVGTKQVFVGRVETRRFIVQLYWSIIFKTILPWYLNLSRSMPLKRWNKSYCASIIYMYIGLCNGRTIDEDEWSFASADRVSTMYKHMHIWVSL